MVIFHKFLELIFNVTKPNLWPNLLNSKFFFFFLNSLFRACLFLNNQDPFLNIDVADKFSRSFAMSGLKIKDILHQGQNKMKISICDLNLIDSPSFGL